MKHATAKGVKDVKLYLLRHGETHMNVKGSFCGFSDPPLSENGQKQAHKAAEELKVHKFDRVITSPLKRAVETAEIVTGLTSEAFIFEPDFREMNFGDWEGLTYPEIVERDRDYARAWEMDTLNLPCQGGESMVTFHNRVIQTYEAYHETFEASDNILLVAHAGVIRSLLTEALHRSMDGYWRYRLDNCGLAVLDYVGDFPVLTHLSSPSLAETLTSYNPET